MKNPKELQIIEELISKNEIEEVLALLKHTMNEENYAKKHRKSIIMTCSEFESLMEKERNGCIKNSDFELQFRQYKKSLLEVVYSLPITSLIEQA